MTRRNMLLVILACFLIAREGSAISEPHVKVIHDSMKSSAYEVSSGSGRTSVKARAVQVEVVLPKGENTILNVSMLYDAPSKLFWWQAEPGPAVQQPVDISQLLPQNSVFFLTASKFVMFWNGWVSADRILVRESAEHYSTFDEGQSHVLHVLEERRGDIEAGMFLQEYKEIKFEGLDRDFIFRKNVANLVGPKLREVKHVGNNWRIVEDGPNGGSAVITLSETYQVLSTDVQPAT